LTAIDGMATKEFLIHWILSDCQISQFSGILELLLYRIY